MSLQAVHEFIVEPALNYHFLATFFIGLLPSPTDYAFSRISGLSNELQVSERHEGGDNTGSLYLPERVRNGRIVFQDGVRLYSPLKSQFSDAMENFDTSFMTVIILLLDTSLSIPLASWTLSDALPVRWSVGELDASGNSALVSSLELSYRELLRIGVYA
ncbi:phage tail protein [Pseudomonas aeruginosa]|uniref:phage tail protein n=1 Tax=Pseudomonas aeruginosa TaxID=287 RepID=UPI003D2658C2|nr:phage tail protein [Pseudomonas aeruginosa]